MKDSLRTAFFLLAPCIALGAFAVILSRRPPAKLKTAATLYGPFGFSVEKVGALPLRPIDVSEGYDRRFEMVLQASGNRPKWWGQTSGSRMGVEIKNWKVWTERAGKQTPLPLKNSRIWTTEWDANNKRYFNEFFLHCGSIPADASLKVSGSARVSLRGLTTYTQSIPFQATLKAAGTSWNSPQVSTFPRMVIRKVEILKPHGGQTVALVTMFVPPGADFGNASQYMARALTKDWRSPSSYIYGVSFSSSTTFAPKSPSPRVQTFEFQWPAESVRRAPERDLLVTTRYSVANSWPLEIAFPIKKDGKPLFGIVAPISRPAGK